MWKALVAHYEDKRLLINKLLAKLFAIPKMSDHTTSEHSRVLNHMINVLHALKALGSPIEYWDHMTVFLLSKKVTPRCQSK